MLDIRNVSWLHDLEGLCDVQSKAVKKSEVQVTKCKWIQTHNMYPSDPKFHPVTTLQLDLHMYTGHRTIPFHHWDWSLSLILSLSLSLSLCTYTGTFLSCTFTLFPSSPFLLCCIYMCENTLWRVTPQSGAHLLSNRNTLTMLLLIVKGITKHCAINIRYILWCVCDAASFLPPWHSLIQTTHILGKNQGRFDRNIILMNTISGFAWNHTKNKM